MSRGELATLGITVDAQGAITQVNRLDQSLNKLGATSVAQTRGMSTLNALHAEAVGKVGAHSLSYGRLEQALASFSGHAIGLPPVLEKLSVSMGKFAMGSIEITAVLIGIAAVAAAWDVLTNSARKAGEAQDKAIENLARRAQMEAAGPGGQTTLDLGEAYSKRNRLEAEKAALSSTGVMSRVYGGRDRIKEIDDEIIGVNALIGLGEKWKKAAEAAEGKKTLDAESARLKKIADDAKKATDAYNALTQAVLMYDAQAERDWRAMFKGGKGDLYDMSAIKGKMADMHESITKEATSYTMPSVGVNDALTQKQIKIWDKMLNADEIHAKAITGAIAQSAQQIGAIMANVVGAVVGSSKGAQIGGALGGVAGGGAASALVAGSIAAGAAGSISGAVIGSVVPVVGTIVGSIIGGAIGGLFDHHKKAVDKNTAALNALTNALYNTPSGYKVDYNRDRAADARTMYDQVAQEALARARRGGAQLLSVAA
jgi:hypothetical protein